MADPQTEHRLKVLVAEDEILNQEYIKALLDCCNADYLVVSNGQEVLDALKKSSYDLLFLDCQMPVLDGWATIKIIREQEEASGFHLPVFALTGSAISGDDSIFQSAGMDGLLLKPPGVADIRRLFADICNGHYSKPSALTLVVKPLLRREELAVKYAQLPDLLKNLAQIYLSNSDEPADMLRQALFSQKSKEIVFFAHKLKGMCANFGESDFRQFLDQIELNPESTLETAAATVSELDKYLSVFKKEIETLL